MSVLFGRVRLWTHVLCVEMSILVAGNGSVAGVHMRMSGVTL